MTHTEEASRTLRLTFRKELYEYVKLSEVLALALGAVGLISGTPLSAASEKHQSAHKHQSAVVTQKPGALFIITPEGATYQLNQNQERRRGYAPFKEATR